MGYKCEEFVNEVDENLICSICHEVLQDPHGCKDGHSFCKECITGWLRTRQTCPLDNNNVQVNSLVRNLIVHNMVENLEVWCDPTVKGKGASNEHNSSVDWGSFGYASTPLSYYARRQLGSNCKWKGKRLLLSKHRESCPFQQVQCPNENCNKKILRRELRCHDENCKYKKMACVECRKRLFRHELHDHTAVECPGTLVICPNACLKQPYGQIHKIKRADLNKHLKDECAKTMVFCPFQLQGCSVQIERQDVDKHVQDSMAEHMLLLANENKQLKEELTRVKEEFHAQLLSSNTYNWAVRDYPKLAKNHPNGSCITSPPFWLRGYQWRFILYPNGMNADATGFISLFLNKVEDDLIVLKDAISIPYRLTVVSQKPGTTDVYHETEHVFTKEKSSLGWNPFMKASDVLLPSYCVNGILIIKCTIQIEDKPQ